MVLSTLVLLQLRAMIELITKRSVDHDVDVLKFLDVWLTIYIYIYIGTPMTLDFMQLRGHSGAVLCEGVLRPLSHPFYEEHDKFFEVCESFNFASVQTPSNQGGMLDCGVQVGV